MIWERRVCYSFLVTTHEILFSDYLVEFIPLSGSCGGGKRLPLSPHAESSLKSSRFRNAQHVSCLAYELDDYHSPNRDPIYKPQKDKNSPLTVTLCREKEVNQVTDSYDSRLRYRFSVLGFLFPFIPSPLSYSLHVSHEGTSFCCFSFFISSFLFWNDNDFWFSSIPRSFGCDQLIVPVLRDFARLVCLLS